VSVFTNGNDRLSTTWAGDATSNMTIACWLWLSYSTPVDYREIIRLDPNVYLSTYTDGLTIDFRSSSADHNGPLLAVSTWYHAAMVVVPTSTTDRQICGYVNGTLAVDAADTATFVDYTRFLVGNGSPRNNVLNGNVRDLRIWNRALSATEIVREMRASRPIRWEGLLVWSPFDDDLYTDRSGNGRVWTPSSSPTLQGSMSPRGPMTLR
jgi:hypothetical protein